MLSGPTRTAKRRSSGMASSSLSESSLDDCRREKKRHPLLAKSPAGELQHRGRRSIEPLQVVHRKHDRLRCGEDAQHAEQGDPQGVPLRRRPFGVS